jgi:hypothetical protein
MNPSASPDSGFRTAMQQLTSAISSGDLKSAQSAYATLTSMQQSSGTSGSTGPMAQFLSSVGADLSKGDLTSAQNALTSFQKTHHHKQGGADSSTATDTSSTASTQTASTNILDISA